MIEKEYPDLSGQKYRAKREDYSLRNDFRTVRTLFVLSLCGALFVLVCNVVAVSVNGLYNDAWRQLNVNRFAASVVSAAISFICAAFTAAGFMSVLSTGKYVQQVVDDAYLAAFKRNKKVLLISMLGTIFSFVAALVFAPFDVAASDFTGIWFYLVVYAAVTVLTTVAFFNFSAWLFSFKPVTDEQLDAERNEQAQREAERISRLGR